MWCQSLMSKGRGLVGCCCCAPEGVGDKRSDARKENMALAPAPAAVPILGKVGGGAATVPLRLPSTKLSRGRPGLQAAPIVSSLAVSEQTVLRAEKRDLALDVGATIIPHPDKVAKGGEDAYFIRSDYNGGVLGVADGVSGWAEENVDPALFSKELMAHAQAAVGTEDVRNDPRQLLAKAHSATASIGAATAIVAILDKHGVLYVANVGDCGLRVVREGRVVHATLPQQHYFDCPYQLSSEDAQTAADAAVYELGVLEGDTIVMGSDGLFDNVFDYDIEAVVKMFSEFDEDPAGCTAVALASLACKHAKDRRYDSPYAKEAILQGHDLPWWRKVIARQKIGGKIDDITVVVGRIVYAPTSPGTKDPRREAAKEVLSSITEEKSTISTANNDSQIQDVNEFVAHLSEEKSLGALDPVKAQEVL